MTTTSAVLALENKFTIFHTTTEKIGFRCPAIKCVDCIFGNSKMLQQCSIAHDIYIDKKQHAQLTSSHPEFFI
jgi:hypothetical protein